MMQKNKIYITLLQKTVKVLHMLSKWNNALSSRLEQISKQIILFDR